MANIKTTQKEWEQAREYFACGLSLSKIVEKTGISKSMISKKSIDEKWAKRTEKGQLVADAVRVEEAKRNLTRTALSVHIELVTETVDRLVWLSGAQMENAVQSMEAPCFSQQDFKSRAETLSKVKEFLVGKSPDTAIQINNSTAAGVPAAIDMPALIAAREKIIGEF